MALVSKPTQAALAAASSSVADRRQWVRRVRELPLLPLAILIPFVVMAVFANVIAPYDPTEPIPGAKIFEPPFWMQGANPDALLGTDFQGRDLLSRLIFGARVSLIVGVVGTIVARKIANTSAGRASQASVTRMITWSTQPPR